MSSSHVVENLIIGRALCFALAAAAVSAGCARPISIAETGVDSSDKLPGKGAVHTHSDLAYGRPNQAPFAVVYLTGPEDLEAIAQAWTDHLYFELISCNDRRYSALLFSGPVFKADLDQHHRMLGGGDTATQYKVHIPLESMHLVNDNSIYGPFDVNAYRESARAHGVCLRFRGGNMAGFGLRSNVVRVPLKVREDGGLSIASGSLGTE